MQKTFTKSDWSKMAIVSAPTSTAAAIRQDASGKRWMWTAGGKRVTASLAK